MLGHRLSHFRKLLRNLNHHLGHHTSCHIGPALGSLFLAHSWRFVQHESHTPAFSFLSGSGADQTEQSRVAFARYKGKAEKALLAAGFPRLYIFRPAYIYPFEPRKEPNFNYPLFPPTPPPLPPLSPHHAIPSHHLPPTS